MERNGPCGRVTKSAGIAAAANRSLSGRERAGEQADKPGGDRDQDHLAEGQVPPAALDHRGLRAGIPGDPEQEADHGAPEKAGDHAAERIARHGDVDPDGEIVDVLRERLRRQVGPDRSRDICPDEQADLVLALLSSAGVRR